MPVLSIREKQQFDELLTLVPILARHLAALEGRLTADAPPPARLARVDAAERLRAEIADVLAAADSGPKKMTAKDVLRALEKRGTTCELSLRTVRWHMTQIKRAGQQSAV
jgi:hypothetical protein